MAEVRVCDICGCECSKVDRARSFRYKVQEYKFFFTDWGWKKIDICNFCITDVIMKAKEERNNKT